MEINIPNNLEECYIELDNMSPIDLIKWINDNEHSAVVNAHSGLGRFIRNEWGLWKGSELKTYFEKIGLHHPDDMSSIILTSYHRYKNNKDIGLDNQIQHYVDFWAKNTKYI